MAQLNAAINANSPLEVIRDLLADPDVLSTAGDRVGGALGWTNLFDSVNVWRPDITNLLLDYPAFHVEVGVEWENLTTSDLLTEYDLWKLDPDLGNDEVMAVKYEAIGAAIAKINAITEARN